MLNALIERFRKPRRVPRLYWLFVAAFLLASSMVFFAQPGLLQSLRALAFDGYQRLAPAPQWPDSPVRVVAIDDAALQQFGQWPWPRSTISQLTEELGAAGAAAIAFDVMFAEPDRTSPEQMLAWLPPEQSRTLRPVIANWPTHDSAFAETLARHPTVLAGVLHHEGDAAFPIKAGFASAGDDPLPFLARFDAYSGSLPALTEAARGVGFINWLPDRDQVIRRVPLLARQGDTITPSLTLEALRVAQGASTYIVRSSNASGATAFGQHTGVNEVRIGDFTVPTDANSDIWIHFRFGAPDRYISAATVLSGQLDPNEVSGRIVLIGATAPGLLDLRATPLNASIAGAEVHQQILEQMLSGRFLTRPDFAPGLEWLVGVLAVLLISVIAPRTNAAVSTALGLGVIATVCVAGVLLFVYARYLFDPVFPAASAFFFAAGSATYLYRRAELQRAEIRRAFSQYVAPNVVKELTANPDLLKLGGEVRDLTVLVSDVRNFTTIAEGMTAEQLTTFINRLLTPLSDIIIEHGGTIDKYMGDSIMAFWNAPLDDPEHARRACNVALLMGEKIRELNVTWRAEAEAAGRPFTDVALGVGINSGECCVGNLGSDRHFDYSAIGDTVNVTSRLEGLTKVYGLSLLIGEETAHRLPDLPFVEVDLVRVKGRKAPSRIYTLLPDEVSPAPQHRDFLDAYRAAQWESARALLPSLQQSAPTPMKRLYTAFEARLERLAGVRAEDWDGVYEFEQK
ncbi:MAG TPA: adenylate/guanylate cyclase domain-containing protein [Vitreimonas sp.]|nr:adenylate/guanylate cyclase domain-containing protein [Vitreimonas sp.]